MAFSINCVVDMAGFRPPAPDGGGDAEGVDLDGELRKDERVCI